MRARVYPAAVRSKGFILKVQHRCCCGLAALLLLAMPSAVLAQIQGAPQGVMEESTAGTVRLPLWEIGVVGLGMSQQAYPGASQQVGRGLALPYLIYRGRFLRADREGLGIRTLNTPRFEFDIGLAAAFGAPSDEVDARRGMPDLGTLVEFGPRLKWHLNRGSGGSSTRAEFALRGVFDLDDRLSHKGISFEPRLIHEWRGSGGWRYNASVGALLGNRRLADTFYGVAPAYVTATRPAYTAESGLIAWRLGAGVSRELTPHLRIFGFAHLDTVAGAANRDSPLVQQTTGGSVGLGLTYTFARSSTLVLD
jgi:outer membrane protein